MRLKVILRYVGATLMMLSLLMLVSAFVAKHDGWDTSTTPLLYSAIITFIIGAFQLIFVRPPAYINAKEGYAIVVSAWVSACIFGMLPYLIYGHEFDFTNALFESVSGFSTTGASILNDIEGLPRGLLMWRTLTSWVGGFGIVTIFSLLVPRGHDGRSILSGAEMSDIAKSQVNRRGKMFIICMLGMYIGFDICCSISLRLTGMGWFDAVTNAISTCSTCGFCVRNASIAAYNNPAVEGVLIFYMLLCGISFFAMYATILRRDYKGFFKSEILRAYLGLATIFTIVITVNLLKNGQADSFMHALRMAAFQVSSIITTTGFATEDTTTWPALSMLILTVAALVCGCSGSTAGGIKIDRIVLLFKDLKQGIGKINRPNAVIIPKLNGHIVGDAAISAAKSYVLVYITLIFAGAAINLLAGMDMESGVSASFACIGNVGPGFGQVGSFGNYADLPAVAKYNSMVLMLAGRLEILPLLVILRSFKK